MVRMVSPQIDGLSRPLIAELSLWLLGYNGIHRQLGRTTMR